MIKVTITKSKPSAYGAYYVHDISYKFFADDDIKGVQAFADANKDYALKFERI